MVFSDDHDESRAIARFGERGALAASALVFTLDGVPLIYNGMEVGDTTESTAPALFERLPIFWPIAERRPDFPRFYKQLIDLRRKHAALREGNLQWIENSDQSRIVSFERRGRDEELLVIVNLSNRPFSGRVGVRNLSSLTEITPRIGQPKAEPGRHEPAARSGGWANVTLDAYGFRVFRRPVR